MKVAIYSDLHLEFCPEYRLPKTDADICVLAGDICVAKQYWGSFFRDVSSKYKQIVYVMGNHEHYGTDLTKTKNFLFGRWDQEGASNITLLDNDAYFVPKNKSAKDNTIIAFVGSTLWTDCNKGNPITKLIVQNYMNDFERIAYNNKRFTVDDMCELHAHSLMALENRINSIIEINKPYQVKIILVTHHGMSLQSIDPRFAHAGDSNFGFVSDLESWVLSHPEIILHIHGHIHNSKDYMIGTTRVITNPAGYPRLDGSRENPAFHPYLTVEI